MPAMRRALPLLFVTTAAVLASGCGGGDGDTKRPGASATTSSTTTATTTTTAPAATKTGADIAAELTVEVQATGSGAAGAGATITCPPDHFANNAVRDACNLVAASPEVLDAYEVDPAAGVCADTGAGPQRATITGTYEGRAVKTSYARTDACAVAHWDAAAALFTAAGYAG